MKIIILTEGGKNIGFGHITRCMALYQAFEEKGIMSELIINGDEDVKCLLGDKNYRILNWLRKEKKTFELVKKSTIVIIDSYLASISLYENLSNLVEIPVYIDDTKRLNYPRGIVLNGNVYAKTLHYPEKDGVAYLLGTKYTPLRKDFWHIAKKEITKRIRSVMVTFGGDDKRNMTPKILQFLNDRYPELIKNVVIGIGFQNIKEIKKLKNKKTNLVYMPDAEAMKKIMLESDLAISAGGQTLYELARIGVPTIGICVADNQWNNIQEWSKVKFLEYVGWYTEKEIFATLERAITKLKAHRERLKCSQIGRRVVDGKGAVRIVDKILKENNFKADNLKIENANLEKKKICYCHN